MLTSAREYKNWENKPPQTLSCCYICTDLKQGPVPLFKQKWSQNKSYLELNGASDRGPASGSLGVSHRGKKKVRAAGSHFLCGASPKWPIVTPDRLNQEVTTGHSRALETKWSDYAMGAQWWCLCFLPHLLLTARTRARNIWIIRRPAGVQVLIQKEWKYIKKVSRVYKQTDRASRGEIYKLFPKYMSWGMYLVCSWRMRWGSTKNLTRSLSRHGVTLSICWQMRFLRFSHRFSPLPPVNCSPK